MIELTRRNSRKEMKKFLEVARKRQAIEKPSSWLFKYRTTAKRSASEARPVEREGGKREMRPECTFEGCKREQVGQKLCDGHYKQKRKGKPLTALKPYKRVQRDETGKVCSTCDKHKAYEEFYADNNAPDGRVNQCIDCHKEARGWQPREPAGPCTFEGCGLKRESLGLCEGHYSQMRRGIDLKPLREKYARVERTETGKVCRSCKEHKKYEEFHKHARATDGRQSSCIACQKVRDARREKVAA